MSLLIVLTSAFLVSAVVASRLAAGRSSARRPGVRAPAGVKGSKPRTGGVAIVAGIAVATAAAWLVAPAEAATLRPLLVGAACVAVVAFVEDRRGVAIPLRLLAYVLAAVLLVASWDAPATLALPGTRWSWPAAVAQVCTVLFLAWMVNLYNFMDGIDGFAAGMAVAGFAGYAMLGLAAGSSVLPLVAGGTAAAAGGFLVHNFPPARIFMGDLGAAVLGYMAAGLALWGQQQGVFPLWVGVLIFSPFIADATITLLRRALARERVWERHRTHGYQQLAHGGWGHRKTTLHGYGLMGLAAACGMLAPRLSVSAQWQLIVAWALLYTMLAWLIPRAAHRSPLPHSADGLTGSPSGAGMRILVVSQYYWPESFPINDVVRGLRELGHEPLVLTGKPNYPRGRFHPGYGFLGPGSETHEGTEIRRVPLVPRGGGSGWRLALNYLSFAVSASTLGPLRCRDDVDAVLVYAPSPITVAIPGLILGRLRRAPVLLWVQDLWPECLRATGAVRSPRLLSLVGRLVQAIYGRSDLVLVPSRQFVPAVERLGTDRSRIRYLPNTAAETYRPVAPTDAPATERLVPDGFVVMFAGNVGAAQGFESILDAAGQLRDRHDIHWVVLGDGRRLDWLRRQVDRLDLRSTIHLLGRHPVESMPRFFAHADALLVSLRRNPALEATVPGKVVTYLACGRPVIAALAGEGARIVEEAGAGIVVPPEDARGLAEAVLQMAAKDPRERAEMGSRGRLHFERQFARSKVLEQLSACFTELVGGSEPALGAFRKEDERCVG